MTDPMKSDDQGLPLWLVILILIGILLTLALVSALFGLPSGDMENLTVVKDLDADPGPPPVLVGYSVMIVGLVLMLVINHGNGRPEQHRCHQCGKVLKRTPDSYYCMRCREHYSIEDVETEVVE